ncbi:uncharacterized protein LOC144653361 [Oculina patagonica]
MSRLILVPLLVLSIVAVGQCGTPVACNSGNKNIRYTAFDRTASSNTWEYITSVANNPDEEIRKRDCRDECEGVCVDAREGGPNFDPWPGCKAFSSYVNSGGGTCYCYGWDHKPEWYESSRYRSGWCESD